MKCLTLCPVTNLRLCGSLYNSRVSRQSTLLNAEFSASSSVLLPRRDGQITFVCVLVATPVTGVWKHILLTSHGVSTLRWRHNDHAGVSNHQPHGCLLNRLFRRKSKKTSKLRVTGLCAGNSPGTGEFPAQMASYAESVSIWWRHHGSPRRVQLHLGKLDI